MKKFVFDLKQSEDIFKNDKKNRLIFINFNKTKSKIIFQALEVKKSQKIKLNIKSNLSYYKFKKQAKKKY